MLEDFNLKNRDKYYLIFLIIFSSILVMHYINFNMKIGVQCSDVYIYLLNALHFTGVEIQSTEFFYISPIICFLTSILFRLGLADRIAIYIVTGAIAIIGNIGVYLLLRQYYDENLSITGAVIYSTLTLNLAWLANGTLDVPAVGMTIWFVLFTIMAIDKNPKFYRYAFPLFVIGFFTRYTLILTVPALLLYYVYRNGFKIKSTDLKYIKQGILIGAILAIVILAVVLIMGHGQFGVASQMTNGISGKQGSQKDNAYNTDLGYYFFNLPNFISNSHTVFEANPVLENPTPLAWAIFAILMLGLVLWIKKNEIKIEKKHALPAIIFIVAILTYTRISSVITTLIVLLGLYLLGKDSENKTGYMMIAWALSNFIFFSYYSIKVNRYILPNIIPIILIVLFAVQGFAFTETFEPTDKYTSTEAISDYLIEIEPDYQDIEIGVYNIRPYRWWIGENTVGIPTSEVNNIDNSNLTYYISNTPLNGLNNYTEIKNIDKLYLYEKVH